MVYYVYYVYFNPRAADSVKNILQCAVRGSHSRTGAVGSLVT
eukprot:COSAG01_NODE_49669_length_370_cov_0.745387_1_plen_41_part_10